MSASSTGRRQPPEAGQPAVAAPRLTQVSTLADGDKQPYRAAKDGDFRRNGIRSGAGTEPWRLSRRPKCPSTAHRAAVAELLLFPLAAVGGSSPAPCSPVGVASVQRPPLGRGRIAIRSRRCGPTPMQPRPVGSADRGEVGDAGVVARRRLARPITAPADPVTNTLIATAAFSSSTPKPARHVSRASEQRMVPFITQCLQTVTIALAAANR